MQKVVKTVGVSRFMDVPKLSGYDSQSLLFGKFPRVVTIKPAVSMPESFYDRGFAVVKGVKSAQEANEKLHCLLSSIDRARAGITGRFLDRLTLAKCDRIPVCLPCVESDFVALHFDMGQPFAGSDQLMLVATGLWCPLDASAEATTRLAFIPDLLARKFGSKVEVEGKLKSYASLHGDGWSEPTRVNTRRIACFGRLIDALSGKRELLGFYDYAMEEWFQVSDDPGGLKSLDNECRYFSDNGIDLASCEVRLRLEPGDLLVFDNLRCVHGRIGKRAYGELQQFLFGVKSASEEDVDTFRSWVAGQASE